MRYESIMKTGCLIAINSISNDTKHILKFFLSNSNIKTAENIRNIKKVNVRNLPYYFIINCHLYMLHQKPILEFPRKNIYLVFTI